MCIWRPMPKVAGFGDAHFTSTQPRSRRDNYPEAQAEKFQWALDYMIANHVSVGVFPGDVLESARESHATTQRYIRMFLRAKNMYRGTWEGELEFLAIPGNHDTFYHSGDLSKSPLGVLQAAGAIIILTAEPYSIGPVKDNIWVYGAGWEESIPVPQDTAARNILVTHQMVVKEKLFHDQTDFVYGHDLLNKHPEYEVIISGDNHHFFTYSTAPEVKKRGMGEKVTKPRRHLINAGSLMRKTSDQQDHEPSMVIWDSETHSIEQIKLKVAPVSEVYDVASIAQEKAANAELDAFIEQVRGGSGSLDLDFLHTLNRLAARPDVEPAVRAAVKLLIPT